MDEEGMKVERWPKRTRGRVAGARKAHDANFVLLNLASLR